MNQALTNCVTESDADPDRVTQVLVNLVGNATKYTHFSDSITVEAVALDKYLQVNVIDTGLGIPEGDQKRVFDRFFRVEGDAAELVDGTGLGIPGPISCDVGVPGRTRARPARSTSPTRRMESIGSVALEAFSELIVERALDAELTTGGADVSDLLSTSEKMRR